MRALVAIAALWLAAGLAAQPASARQVYQGGDLIRNCATQEVCDAFFSGLLDARGTLMTWTDGRHLVCPARPLSTAEIWPIVSTYLQQHPDQLPFYASSSALNALQASYRCPADSGGTVQILDRVRDATDLVALCQNLVLCQAFTIGVLDSHQALADWKIVSPLMCLPDTAELREAMLVILTFIGEHPQQLRYSAGSVALTALSTRYPCVPAR